MRVCSAQAGGGISEVDAAYNIGAVSVSSRVQHGGANAFIGTQAAAVGGQLSATFRRMFALI